jgi:hypothetical protein
MPDDTTARDALERGLRYRLPLCSEEELRAIDRMLTGIEKRRELLEVGRQVSASESVVEHCPLCGRPATDASPVTFLSGAKVGRANACPCGDMFRTGGVVVFDMAPVERGLAELRASMTYGPLADAGTSVIGDNS